MDDNPILPLAIGMIAFVFVLSTGLVIWLVAQLRRTSDKPLSQDAAGVIAVPVRRLQRTLGFFGRYGNGIGARLAVAPDGLRFKVFKPDHWPFPDITEVNAPRMLFATRITIRHRGGARLLIDLAGRARARDLLRVLPTSVPLTRRAAALRDDEG
ncbi:hypothetical protein [Roseomonas indoligenes]|uniref:DUF2550 family protein n=1 Tax=Roseomonas indoligenes TaxID=2820811 RepID=A0A940N0Y6_9PROT|nr:hypothetical protein [Pararoseomonas indoligenes]MBP0494056.1 hypothetical protein [Pararoseomonas indoligenes]